MKENYLNKPINQQRPSSSNKSAYRPNNFLNNYIKVEET